MRNIQKCIRFIEQQDFHLLRHRHRKEHPAAFTVAKFRHPPRRKATQLQKIQSLIDDAIVLGRMPIEKAHIRGPPKAHKFTNRHAVKGHICQITHTHQGDKLSPFPRRPRLLLQQGNISCQGRNHSRKGLEQRTLAATIFTHQGNNFAGIQFKGKRSHESKTTLFFTAIVAHDKMITLQQAHSRTPLPRTITHSTTGTPTRLNTAFKGTVEN